MQRTIFITGASSGLGKATAKLFQSKGWNVIATMRNTESGSDLAKLENVTLLELDITNYDQIRSVVSKVNSLADIDVVFNNAGFVVGGAFEALQDEQIVRQINTNILGTLRVTREFIPYFREKRKGMFINTTSMGGIFTFPMISVYHATKFALEGWSEGLSFELKPFNIQIKTVAPGEMSTNLFSSIELGRHKDYDEFTDKIVNRFNGEDCSTPRQIADVVYEAATDGKDQIRYIAGEDAKAMYSEYLRVGNEAFRLGIEKKLLDL